MLLRALRNYAETSAQFSVDMRVDLPVRMAPEFAEAAFGEPLRRFLVEHGLGTVESVRVNLAETGEPDALQLDLRLLADGPAVRTQVTDFLESLDAPLNSTLGHRENATSMRFGTCEGLGIYMPAGRTTEDTRLSVAEACTEALAGAGVYQGSATFGETTALYFYGDSFNRMRAAMTFLITHDPNLEHAIVRRLT